MKPKPHIESVLILTGTKNARIASEFFKNYFFSKDKSLDKLQGRKELSKVWVKDPAAIAELEAIIDKRIEAYAAKELDLSAKLREEEWALVAKLSKMGELFNQYTNRSGGVFEYTRVYLAFREPTA